MAGFPLVLTDPRGAFGYSDRSPTRSSLIRLFGSDDKRQWQDGLDRVANEGGFLFVLTYLGPTYLVCSGRRL